MWGLLVSSLIPYVRWSPRYLNLPSRLLSDELSFLSILFWTSSVACIKISITLTYPQIYHATVWKKSISWKVFLFGMIGLQAAVAIANIIFALAQCRPVAASWNPYLKNAKCSGPLAIRIISTFSSCVHIITDIILSLLPISFVRQLQRPLQEKILICALMAVGLVASAASIRKTLLVQLWTIDSDYATTGFQILIWTCVESFVGLIAACLPLMKPLFTQAIEHLSIKLRSSDSLRASESTIGCSPASDPKSTPLRDQSTNSEDEFTDV